MERKHISEHLLTCVTEDGYCGYVNSLAETSAKKLCIGESILTQPENNGTFATGSIEDKYFPGLFKTLTEVLRFTGDYLNGGRNEIIFLDKKKKSVVKPDSEYHISSNVSRFGINKIVKIRRNQNTDAIKDGFLNCFDRNATAIAEKHIAISTFIKVKITGGNKCDYVIEMDIETLFIFSKNLNNSKETTNTFKNNYKDMIYVRTGPFTILIENQSDQRFTVKELSGLELNRNCFKTKTLNFLPSWQYFLALKYVDPNHYSTTLTKMFLNYICKLLRYLSSIETCVSILENPNEITDKRVYTQIPRGFKEDPSEEYCEGYILSQPESDGTLATRCFEFKYFADCVKNSTKNVLIKFLIEVLKFSCGCLNKRRNGTIYFGIADNRIKKKPL